MKNLVKRHNQLPKHLQIDLSRTSIRVLLPKLHILTHKPECRDNFAFGNEPGTAVTDGEEVERVWWGNNGSGNSTKEMTAGCRQDTLDSCIDDWNYRKFIDLGKQFSLICVLRY